MAQENACAGRVARLRALMDERGYDAVILRNNPDLLSSMTRSRTPPC